MNLKIHKRSPDGQWEVELNDNTRLGHIKKYGDSYHVRVELDYYQEVYLDISKHPSLKEAKDFVRENFATKESFAQSVASAVVNKKFA